MTSTRTSTWRDLWDNAADRLRPVAGDRAAARVEARWFCEEASGAHGDEWLEVLDEPARARHVAHLDAMLARRVAGEPTAYALGSWSFRTLELMVDRRVLIPRPETEQVVEVALGLVRAGGRRPVRLADLGTGSGAIALSLAAELWIGWTEVWATDVSPDALDVARANTSGLGRPASAVRLGAGSWFDALPGELAGTFDLVVSNPPYVADGDDLDEAVRRYEPPLALFAGPDGLDAVRVLVAGAPEWLAPGGWLVVEIGAGQGPAAARLAEGAGLTEVEVRPDLAGRDRVLLGRRPL